MREDIRKILVMHTGGWIGDMVLLTPALRAIRNAYPDAHISILVNPLVEGLMSRNPYIDKVIVYDKRGEQKGMRNLLGMASALKEEGFDMAILFHPNSIRSALLAFLARIPIRVGTNTSKRGIFLTDPIPDESDLHEVERYLRVARIAGAKEVNDRLEFWHGPAERSYAQYKFMQFGIRPRDFVIGINPSTTWPSKAWAPENFAALADMLAEEAGARIIITGSPDDVPLAEKIEEMTRCKVINLAGRTDIFQLGAVIELCDLFISCDSGPMHIAAAVGTPTVALFGPTSPTRHRPYGQNHIVIRHPFPCSPCYRVHCPNNVCLSSITPSEVAAAILSRRRKWRNT
ncbi:lipopolysaccharide heptosyltransferase II [Candidatus Poribacteria bacterium]|nr:lipopolysaccharide heptosyltransferase II [Candidatus Poribacteria bacterium]